MVILPDFFLDLSGLLDHFDATPLPVINIVPGYLPCKIGLHTDEEPELSIFVYSDDIEFKCVSTEDYIRDSRPMMFDMYLEDLNFFLDLWNIDLAGNIGQLCAAIPILSEPKRNQDFQLENMYVFPIPNRFDPVKIRIKALREELHPDNIPVLRRLRYTDPFTVPGNTTDPYTIKLFDIPIGASYVKIKVDGRTVAVAEVLSIMPPNIDLRNIYATAAVSISREDQAEIIPIYHGPNLVWRSLISELLGKGILKLAAP